ncbi:hypothetical protein [Pleionea litopenaei]|uniref:Uncharacterized protein n=1 Tax=Pleionea litopenaei TaxID=3070815 RepID=A0AA51RR16_9GAMM|nr:hypothetical protein [Pleionea sp. HL-JVS1]WMS86088.1 hypothetical protein Q9312_12755 [Pleionea sp. HL-JVS1]
MKLQFRRPPLLALICYVAGFVLIIPTFCHQYFNLAWISATLNLQLFIAGALIVAVGSLLNWTIPLLQKR